MLVVVFRRWIFSCLLLLLVESQKKVAVLDDEEIAKKMFDGRVIIQCVCSRWCVVFSIWWKYDERVLGAQMTSPVASANILWPHVKLCYTALAASMVSLCFLCIFSICLVIIARRTFALYSFSLLDLIYSTSSIVFGVCLNYDSRLWYGKFYHW